MADLLDFLFRTLVAGTDWLVDRLDSVLSRYGWLDEYEPDPESLWA